MNNTKHNSKRSKKDKEARVITASLVACVLIVVVLAILTNKPENSKEDKKTESVSENQSSQVTTSVDDTSSQETVSKEVKAEKPAPKKLVTDKKTQELKKQNDSIKKAKENTVVVKTSYVDESALSQRAVCLEVDFLPQNPELPTGCEITSLTTVLHYCGYTVTKTEMSDNYLEKKTAPSDWNENFVGNPRDPYSFGCYAGPITKAANKFFAENGNKHTAKNMSGVSFTSILQEVDNGRPVVLWGTADLREAYKTVKWTVDGKEMQWTTPEHCYVLIGYDLDKGIAIISDPLKDIVQYDLKTVVNRYDSMNKQCVFIYGDRLKEPPAESDDSSEASEEPTEYGTSEEQSTIEQVDSEEPPKEHN